MSRDSRVKQRACLTNRALDRFNMALIENAIIIKYYRQQFPTSEPRVWDPWAFQDSLEFFDFVKVTENIRLPVIFILFSTPWLVTGHISAAILFCCTFLNFIPKQGILEGKGKKFKKTEAFHHAILNPRPTKEVCVWLARVIAYLTPFMSQILDFIYWTVLIFILIYFEWRDTENQHLTLFAYIMTKLIS